MRLGMPLWCKGSRRREWVVVVACFNEVLNVTHLVYTKQLARAGA